MNASFLAGTLSWGRAALWATGAVVAFNLAYEVPVLSILIVAYLFCLLQLARARTGRQAFYTGLGVGLLTAGLQLQCFWAIFGPGAAALWLILAFWIGSFAALSRLCLARFGIRWTIAMAPILWTGLEYFRSELYYLRFSWLNVGYVISGNLPLPTVNWLGMYGIGFLAMAVAALLALLRPRIAGLTGLTLATLAVAGAALHSRTQSTEPADVKGKSVRVAGVQMEFPTDAEVIAALDRLIVTSPEAELLVLSEYTFLGPVPDNVKRWCREHKRYLIVGGKEPTTDNFYDTAFVIGPDGRIVFRQGKCVPIQFFKDGLPAPEQNLWGSPWGRVGICICYDLSYTRVTDRLIRLGAEALVVPTMDVVDWGRQEHELHARVAPVRAAEYRVPILRVASSGISQLVDGSGRCVAQAGFPGDRETISGQLQMGQAGSLPLDRWLAPAATGLTVMLVCLMLVGGRRQNQGQPPGIGAI